MSVNRISGFRPFHSNRDNRKINLAVFIDLKKAFDTVDHEIVLPKLFLCGIQGTELQWFKSIFLIVSNKLLYTYVNGVLSSSENYSNILCGVPQSSIFLLYVNDLPGCLTNFIPNMYANDTIITTSKAAINVIDKLYQWRSWLVSAWMASSKPS